MAPDPIAVASSTSYDYFDDLGISDLAWGVLAPQRRLPARLRKTLKEMDDPSRRRVRSACAGVANFPCPR